MERTNPSDFLLAIYLELNLNDSRRQIVIPDDLLSNSIGIYIEVFKAVGEMAQADWASKSILPEMRVHKIFRQRRQIQSPTEPILTHGKSNQRFWQVPCMERCGLTTGSNI